MLLFMVKLGMDLGRGEKRSCEDLGCGEPGSHVPSLPASHERELEIA